MSYLVALQSAAFYVLACTPCTSSRQRNKARARARREREEKDRFEAENPGQYRHPDPFHTSPHWDEEIMMGPSLPKKGSASKNGSQRRLTSSSSASKERAGGMAPHAGAAVSGSTIAMSPSTGTTTTTAATPTPTPTAATTTTTTTTPTTAATTTTTGMTPHSLPHLGSTSTVVAASEDATSRLSIAGSGSGESSTWNLRRYQREDEELWGHSGVVGHVDVSRAGHKLMDAIVKAGSSAGRLLDSTLLGKERGGERDRDRDHPSASSSVLPVREVTNEERRNFYYSSSVVKNPPVNDYHPPVVSSKPAHRDGRRWMLQPPPPVKVMEAKVPVSRSASMASSVSSSGGGGRRSVTLSSGSGTAARSAPVSENAGASAGPAGRLGRVVGERLMGAKMRSGGNPTPTAAPRPESRTPSFSSSLVSRPPASAAAPTPTTPTARPRGATVSSSHSRQSHRSRRSRSSLSTGADSDSSENEQLRATPTRRPRRGRVQQRPAVTPEVRSEDESDFSFFNNGGPTSSSSSAAGAAATAKLPEGGHAAQRPRLETILSSQSSGQELNVVALIGENVAPGRPLQKTATTATAATVSGPEKDLVGERPGGRSIDSGLALSM